MDNLVYYGVSPICDPAVTSVNQNKNTASAQITNRGTQLKILGYGKSILVYFVQVSDENMTQRPETFRNVLAFSDHIDFRMHFGNGHSLPWLSTKKPKPDELNTESVFISINRLWVNLYKTNDMQFSTTSFLAKMNIKSMDL